ncbi:GNAT family N-acetyltransferase [Salinigranum halophilum]|uniref:GNAT family N-acetyltransferase n=1 Tax=Salinigranum halophilum TaxID=2565931 RepID=UPI0010A79949
MRLIHALAEQSGVTRRVKRVETDEELAAALAVRERVFVEEQGVPPELEVDEYDSRDGATHFVAFDGDSPVGAARLRAYEGGNRGKVERVAVLDTYRGEGLGARLMDAVEAAAERQGFEALVLHAQTAVEGFYARRGYRRVGEEFEEAGIRHVEMVRSV